MAGGRTFTFTFCSIFSAFQAIVTVMSSFKFALEAEASQNPLMTTGCFDLAGSTIRWAGLPSGPGAGLKVMSPDLVVASGMVSLSSVRFSI